MKLFLGLFVSVLLLITALAIWAWSGRYNVAATVPHWDLIAWFMEEVRNRSIKFHSQEIQSPSLKDSKLIKTGFNEYDAMCRLCHGAPGYEPTELARGLYPKPPDLVSQGVQQRSNAELYWVVKNGIKMTGMPAFGPTHNEDELSSVVAFLRRMPGMQAKDYEVLVREAGQHKEGEDHHHASKKH